MRAYARLRGIAHTTVDYHIRKGGITRGDDGLIDVQAADRYFAEQVDKGQSMRARGQQRKFHGELLLPGETPPQPASAGMLPPPVPNMPVAGPDILELRKRIPTDFGDAAYLTAVEQMLERRRTNLQAEGALLHNELVERTQFELARQIRDNMLAIVPRVQDVLAAETDPHAVGVLLNQEIRQALESAAKLAEAMAAEDAQADLEMSAAA